MAHVTRARLRARKGSGSIYREKGARRSRNWMLKWVDPVSGERKSGSSGTADYNEAQKRLREILTAGERGEYIDVGRAVKGWTFARAAQMAMDDLTVHRRSSRQYQARRIARHLAPYFGTFKLAEITTEKITQYRLARQKTGVADATHFLEVGLLRRMFKLAIKSGYRGQVPDFGLEKPANARRGFFERHEFDAVLAHLPDYWKGMFTFAYYTGWRVTSEVATLEWRHVDLRADVVQLFPHETKNGEGRVFPFAPFPELRAVLVDADRVRKEMAKRGVIVARVFHHEGRPLVSQPGANAAHRTGSLLGWVQKAWRDACKLAHVRRIPHDLRRTAVRNLVRFSVSEQMAMRLTGHLTREVFERYNIVNEADLETCVARYAAASRRVADAARAAASE